MDYIILCIVLFLAGYLIGSIPFGLLLGKLAGLGDIRNTGSGNIGATNMVRAGGKKLAALVLLLDGAKGFVAVWLMREMLPLTPDGMTLHLIMALVLASPVIGHIFPVWLKFNGGKGVATSIGVLFGLHWMLGLAYILTWLLVFGIWRVSSLAALLATALMPLFSAVIAGIIYAPLLMAALVLYRHKENIMRLIQGKEHGFEKK